MPDPMQVIPYAGVPVSRWVNGAGRKADIAAGDGWMVGFAWLDTDAPFSDYSGQDRTIMLVEGPGFTLDFDAGRSLTVTTPFVPTPFDGGWPAFCRIAGPSRVLNVITQRDRLAHSFVVTDATGAVPSASALAQILVALGGTVHLSDPTATATLGAWDGLRFDQPLTASTPDDAQLARIAITGRQATRPG